MEKPKDNKKQIKRTENHNENNAFTLSRINGPVIWLLLMVVLCYNKMPSKQYEADIFYDANLKKKEKFHRGNY